VHSAISGCPLAYHHDLNPHFPLLMPTDLKNRALVGFLFVGLEYNAPAGLSILSKQLVQKARNNLCRIKVDFLAMQAAFIEKVEDLEISKSNSFRALLHS
jgi:hypothetical protein